MRSAVYLCGLALGMALASSETGAELPNYGYRVLHAYPHDRHAYTEGLFFLDGFLYESTGQVGQSTIRKVRLEDGAVLQSRAILPSLFGEGIVNWNGEIISLTWQDHVGFRWNLKDFSEIGQFSYAGEGWALTQNGESLIKSDGTSILHFLDPVTLAETRRLQVMAEGRPVKNLNELEWVKGEILANIWLTNRIARIDPATGKVKGWIDVGLLPEARNKANADDVPNGIAYDKAGDRLFITGKDWSHLYEIRLDAEPVR
ncbi:MAG: glutamine cyclotransferase [Rhodospirillales bacterium]|nr:glutamine cyclotransferase [Rhodospirillales bacterium]